MSFESNRGKPYVYALLDQCQMVEVRDADTPCLEPAVGTVPESSDVRVCAECADRMRGGGFAVILYGACDPPAGLTERDTDKNADVDRTREAPSAPPRSRGDAIRVLEAQDSKILKLEDALREAGRPVPADGVRWVSCPCLTCGGTGKYRPAPEHKLRAREPCFVCDGTGRTDTAMSLDQEQLFRDLIAFGYSEIEATARALE